MAIFIDKMVQNNIWYLAAFDIEYTIFDWNGKIDYAIKDNIYYIDPTYIDIFLTQGF